VLPVFAGLRDRSEFEDLLASVGVPADRPVGRISG